QRLRNDCRTDPALWAIPALYVAAGYDLPRQSYTGAELASVEPPPPRTESLQAPDLLLGRERELVELAARYVLDTAQIITIRGAGGMGNTALAHELASRLRYHFRDGIFAVMLALAGEQASLSAAAVRADIAQLLDLPSEAFNALDDDDQEVA